MNTSKIGKNPYHRRDPISSRPLHTEPPRPPRGDSDAMKSGPYRIWGISCISMLRHLDQIAEGCREFAHCWNVCGEVEMVLTPLPRPIEAFWNALHYLDLRRVW